MFSNKTGTWNSASKIRFKCTFCMKSSVVDMIKVSSDGFTKPLAPIPIPTNLSDVNPACAIAFQLNKRS
jgi:hypothetical protein